MTYVETQRYYPKDRDRQEELDAIVTMVQTGMSLPTNAQLEQAWQALYKPHDQLRDDISYEVLSREYIDALGTYLAERVALLGGTEQKPLMVLETGAGDGRLAHHIRGELAGKAPGKAFVVATDNGSWEIPHRFPVEQMDVEEALDVFKPTIVITSWMPHNQDWTPLYRGTPSVAEYILIGEPDGDVCGTYATWGFDSSMLHPSKLAPYGAAGFEEFYLDDVSNKQFRHTRTGTATVSFRREYPQTILAR